MNAAGKLLLIGLDAGDRDFIAAHAADLPHIAALLADGTGGPLDAEPLAGAVWPSFFTRSRPAEHGVFHHLQWDPAQMRMRPTAASWLPTRPFWRDLGEQGVRVATLDVPFVFPGDATNVVEIRNWGSHDAIGSFSASSPAVARWVSGGYGRHAMGVEVPVRKTPAQLQAILGRLIDGTAVKGRLAIDLMRRQPWDMVLVAFGELHRAGHLLWPDPDNAADPAPDGGLLQVYRAVDAQVGAIVGAAGPDADVILFALHGMGPNYSQTHITSMFMRRAIAHFRGLLDPTAVGDAPGLMRMLRRVLPAGLQHWVGQAVPQSVRNAVVARQIGGGYRWADTYGLCLHGDLQGYLRLNIKGREADGVLEPAEAERLKHFLRAELEALTLADGRRLVHRVEFPATDTPGARAHLLPDILVEWDPAIAPADEVHSPTLGVFRARLATGRGGNHRFNGFYTHRGPRQGRGIRPAHIADLGDLIVPLALAAVGDRDPSPEVPRDADEHREPAAQVIN